MLYERAVAYLNVDIAVSGLFTFVLLLLLLTDEQICKLTLFLIGNLAKFYKIICLSMALLTLKVAQLYFNCLTCFWMKEIYAE